jgi:crotonobetainyl-CoA:carnitine CoA-transferase CaiB-like acyl-CoA transferase
LLSDGERQGTMHAPQQLGEHTAEILGELGVSEQQIAELKKKCGVVRRS